MFAGYRDEVLIGEGGLGQLYRCVKESTGGVVAIKELRDVESGSPVWHRARRELDALLRLKGHPYVVSVEEIIEGPHGPCLVMEFAPGGSLMDRLQAGPLAVPEFVLVGQHVTQGLAAAHEQGIVHRDVKPHNLLIASFGQVKVCDFGIAALTRGPDGRTQTQSLTLAYASPEELDGDGEVGPAADVYSFGATALHLLTGSRPRFRDRLLNADTSPGLPPELTDTALQPVGRAIRLSLAHSPDDRPSMADLVEVFDAAAVALGARRITRMPITPAPDVSERVPEPPSSAPRDVAPSLVVDAADDDHTVVRHRPIASEPAGEAAAALDTDATIARAAQHADAATPEANTASAKRPRSRRAVLVGGSLAIVVAAVAGMVLIGGDDDDSGAAAPTTEAAATPGTVASQRSSTADAEVPLAAIAADYVSAEELMAEQYAQADDKYWGDSGLYLAANANTYELRRMECAEHRDIEFLFLDGLNALWLSDDIVDVVTDQKYAEGDLIAALDECAKSGDDQAQINAHDERIVRMNQRALDAAEATRRALGLPPTEQGG